MKLKDADELIAILDEELQKDSSLPKALLVGFAKQILNDAPTVEAEPIRHGHWIYKDTWETFECSVCGRGAIRNDYPYCMWCGAKMDGERKEK